MLGKAKLLGRQEGMSGIPKFKKESVALSRQYFFHNNSISMSDAISDVLFRHLSKFFPLKPGIGV